MVVIQLEPFQGDVMHAIVFPISSPLGSSDQDTNDQKPIQNEVHNQ
jgi:hypothetical protein